MCRYVFFSICVKKKNLLMLYIDSNYKNCRNSATSEPLSHTGTARSRFIFIGSGSTTLLSELIWADKYFPFSIFVEYVYLDIFILFFEFLLSGADFIFFRSRRARLKSNRLRQHPAYYYSTAPESIECDASRLESKAVVAAAVLSRLWNSAWLS